MVYRASMTLEVVSPCLPMRAWPAAHRVWRMHQVSTQAPRCTCRWFTHAHRRAHTHTHTHLHTWLLYPLVCLIPALFPVF